MSSKRTLIRFLFLVSVCSGGWGIKDSVNFDICIFFLKTSRFYENVRFMLRFLRVFLAGVISLNELNYTWLVRTFGFNVEILLQFNLFFFKFRSRVTSSHLNELYSLVLNCKALWNFVILRFRESFKLSVQKEKSWNPKLDLYARPAIRGENRPFVLMVEKMVVCMNQFDTLKER